MTRARDVANVLSTATALATDSELSSAIANIDVDETPTTFLTMGA